MKIVDLTAGLNFPEVDALLVTGGAEQDVEEAVSSILHDVRKRGDAAVCEYTKRFDKFNLVPDLIT
jgi:histidinol dehydrogenase